MKVILHNAIDRGQAQYGWLQANYSFSFANYFDQEKINFGALRVLNDDIIAPRMGFGTHPHDNMEIITIPLKGVLKHRDTMHEEWQSVFARDVQVMSAGSGIEHSEINGSTEEALSLFQIWIIPNQRDVTPRYDQMIFEPENRLNKLQVLVNSIKDSNEGCLRIHQDAIISRLDLQDGKSYTYCLKSKNHGVYLMVIEGNIKINDKGLKSRDAVGITQTANFTIHANRFSQVLFIEVPMLKDYRS